MSSERFPPTVPLVLGVAGLLPFAGLAVLSLMPGAAPLGIGSGQARLALAVYGAVILSFLGGVRWGIVMGFEEQDRATRDYVFAVLPALIGWAALALPRPTDLYVLALAHVLLALLDYGLACRTVAPEWYGRLRMALGAVAALALIVAA